MFNLGLTIGMSRLMVLPAATLAQAYPTFDLMLRSQHYGAGDSNDHRLTSCFEHQRPMFYINYDRCLRVTTTPTSWEGWGRLTTIWLDSEDDQLPNYLRRESPDGFNTRSCVLYVSGLCQEHNHMKALFQVINSRSHLRFPIFVLSVLHKSVTMTPPSLFFWTVPLLWPIWSARRVQYSSIAWSLTDF